MKKNDRRELCDSRALRIIQHSGYGLGNVSNVSVQGAMGKEEAQDAIARLLDGSVLKQHERHGRSGVRVFYTYVAKRDRAIHGGTTCSLPERTARTLAEMVALV
jgi:hypothetical protein